MNKFTKTLLVFILITGPALMFSVHAAVCDPSIAPCNVGSCMPCKLEKKKPVEQNDCTDPNGCPEVTMVKIKPPSNYAIMSQPPFIQPNEKPTPCFFCLWNMNGFFWYFNV